MSLEAATRRLILAAQARDITMGDPCSLLAAKAELAAAARAADEALKETLKGGPGPAPGMPGSSLPGCPHGRGLACSLCYPT